MGLGVLPRSQKAQRGKPPWNRRTPHPEESSTWPMEREFGPGKRPGTVDALPLGEAQGRGRFAVQARQPGDKQVHGQQSRAPTFHAEALQPIESHGVLEPE